MPIFFIQKANPFLARLFRPTPSKESICPGSIQPIPRVFYLDSECKFREPCVTTVCIVRIAKHLLFCFAVVVSAFATNVCQGILGKELVSWREQHTQGLMQTIALGLCWSLFPTHLPETKWSSMKVVWWFLFQNEFRTCDRHSPAKSNDTCVSSQA